MNNLYTYTWAQTHAYKHIHTRIYIYVQTHTIYVWKVTLIHTRLQKTITFPKHFYFYPACSFISPFLRPLPVFHCGPGRLPACLFMMTYSWPHRRPECPLSIHSCMFDQWPNSQSQKEKKSQALEIHRIRLQGHHVIPFDIEFVRKPAERMLSDTKNENKNQVDLVALCLKRTAHQSYFHSFR